MSWSNCLWEAWLIHNKSVKHFLNIWFLAAEECVKFYHPASVDSRDSLLDYICEGSVCLCAEGNQNQLNSCFNSSSCRDAFYHLNSIVSLHSVLLSLHYIHRVLKAVLAQFWDYVVTIIFLLLGFFGTGYWINICKQGTTIINLSDIIRFSLW